MSNLALTTTSTTNNTSTILIAGGSNLGFFNPQRLNGVAESLCFDAEVCKSTVERLHNTIYNHDANIQRFLSTDQEVFLSPLETALKRVDGNFWLKLYDDTKLRNFMDTESYNAQKKALNDIDSLPPFTIENVVNQLEMYVGEVGKIFTKRIVTIFEKLSGTHVTNSAFGFRNRMIIDNCSRSYHEDNKSRYVHDLRCVVATIRGEAEMPSTCLTSSVLGRCFAETGVWHMLDGNSMRMKAFKKGTVHIEIATEIADTLNAILAAEYPNCLPEAGKKKMLFKSTLNPVETMLDSAVRNVFRCIKFDHPRVLSENSRTSYLDQEVLEMSVYHYKPENKMALIETVNLLTELFGEPTDSRQHYRWALKGINPRAMVDHIVKVGTLPDEVSHQFYESTQRIQDYVRPLLTSINGQDKLCEPSAGRGALAQLLPQSQTTCFEINALNCFMLRGQGYKTKQECFLDYANKTHDRYDLFVMNPPYLNGLYMQHLKAAMSLLNPAGRIIAVVPSSVLSKKDELQNGFTVTENHNIKEQFIGTSMLNISIITIEKSATI
ncbi:DUF4942 domain-containing protein [Vibrio coralliirubri]|uniref:DUF4942 domain-containing protein n=1 Tax=Vibrio coralliirubri TaxID=1516159 RepID=UPI0022851923|nr:DUF4942 domain-containing protein [Vibrio coralliirubri]MCY9864994.1 DUF4942 domain-containing protein [Vibrio coralliirubri]